MLYDATLTGTPRLATAFSDKGGKCSIGLGGTASIGSCRCEEDTTREPPLGQRISVGEVLDRMV